MKMIEDLKKELFKKLEEYPPIKAFFRESLQKRVELDDSWTENILVQDILDGLFSEGDALHTLLEAIDKDSQNYRTLREKLTPKDDYDRKMHDVLAELNGYYHLQKAKFTDIDAILETGTRKVPDFSARLNDKEYLFEVKNMRNPIDVGDVLGDKINERKLLIPEIYQNLQFTIKLSDSWGQMDFTGNENQALKLNVVVWLYKLFYLIESGESLHKVSGNNFINQLNKQYFRISCELKEGKHLVIIIPGLGKELSSSVYRKSILLPFLNKALRVIDVGMSQLFEYDKDNRYYKYVLLNWQVPGEFIHFMKESHSIVKGIDGLVKNICDKLYVRLLNKDNLP